VIAAISARILLALWCLLTLATRAPADEVRAAIVTGNNYRELGETARAFYVMGAVEGMQSEAARLTFNPDIVMPGGCVAGRTGRQLMAIVDKYTAEHPELWHTPMSALIYRAVIGGCEEDPRGLKGK
jgi:hypothetical protein